MLTTTEAQVTLTLIGAAIKVYRKPDRCRVCGETKRVFSVKRLTR